MEGNMSAFDHNSAIGTIGTILTLSFSKIDIMLSIFTGILTAAYMLVKLVQLLRKEK